MLFFAGFDCRLLFVNVKQLIYENDSLFMRAKNEPKHNKTNKMTFAPSEDSDQPVHPHRLIRVFTVHLMRNQGPKASSCEQRRL